MAKSFLLERINSLSDLTAVLAVFHYVSCASFLKGLPGPSLSMLALYEPSQASGQQSIMVNSVYAGSRRPGFIPGSPLAGCRTVAMVLNFPCPGLLICKIGIIIVPTSLKFQRGNAHRE